MKQERSGIALLLGLLLLLSSLLGALYAAQATTTLTAIKPLDAHPAEKTANPAKMPEATSTQGPITHPLPSVPKKVEKAVISKHEANGLTAMPVTQVLMQLLPYIQAQSSESIVEQMKGVPPAKAKEIIEAMIKSSLLPSNRIINIIAGLGLQYDGNTLDQDAIFSLLLEKPDLQNAAPVLAIVAYGSYGAIIPALIAWADKQKNSNNQFNWLNSMVDQAYAFAIKKHSLKILRTLREYGQTVSARRASELLWEAASDPKNNKVAQFLINLGADPNYAQKGVTVLMQAVRSGDVTITKVVVEAGADVNLVVNDEVGSALQLAVDLEDDKSPQEANPYITIENYLRSQGAREFLPVHIG